MKSAIAPLLLAVVAVVQALGRYVYHRDSIVVTGEMFFPIFLAGLSIFYGRRAVEGTYSTAKLTLLVAAVLLCVLTLAGWGTDMYWFYPSIWVYYAAFAVLVITAILYVRATPSAREQRAQAHSAKQAHTDNNTAAPVEQDDDGWRSARR